jgi:choice-of-anchor B domain-containing protein
MPRRPLLLCVAALIALAATAGPAGAHPDHDADAEKSDALSPSPMRGAAMGIGELFAAAALPTVTAASCVGGSAGGYPCDKVDLLAFVPLANMEASAGNDLWGWSHEATGRQFAIMGHSSGTAFVEVTNPSAPEFLGTLPTQTTDSLWRDLKVHADHVFVVSEAAGYGMQVFDLTQLLAVTKPQTFPPLTHYDGFGNAHNIVINQATGFAYAVGTATCSGGLHMVDISDPQNPSFAGCFSDDGYTHDAQCVVYHGPDVAYAGRELCFAANEDTFTIVDVTAKDAPVIVARQVYVGSSYSHQGWLTEDHRHFLLDDELDEWAYGTRTKTFIWDLANLERPLHIGTHTGGTAATDHNQYIVGSHSYQANYRSGLRVLDISAVADGVLEEVGFFDIYPASDGAGFNGAWSVYPWLGDGVVAISGMEQGLYLVRFEKPGSATPVHLHDLAPRPRAIDAERWRAVAVVKVRNAEGAPAAGVTVSGTWGAGKKRSCTTDAAGKCKVKVQVRTLRPKIPFEVDKVSGPNGHDPHADRLERVVVRRPTG